MLSVLDDTKELMRHSIGLSDALIHVNLGLGLFLVFCFLLRRNARGPLIAFVLLFVLQTLNELLDFVLNYRQHGTASVTEMAKDYLATLFWPAILAAIWTPLKAAREKETSG